MEKIKVAFITVSTEQIGPNVVILNIAKSLDRSRFEPVVVALAGKGWGKYTKEAHDFTTKFKEADIPVHQLSLPKGLDLFLAVPRLFFLLRKIRPHVVHTHLLRSDVYGRVAAGWLKIPVVSTLHNEDLWLTGKSIFDAITRIVERWTQRYADAYIAVASNVKDFYLAHDASIAESKITVINNAVDTKKYAPNAAIREEKRGELGVTNEMTVIGTTARLIEQKDPLMLLAALEKVFKKNSLARFFWIGEGPLRKEVEERLEKSPHKNRFVLLGQRQDVPDLLQALDIFVLSSLHEGLPMALLEAMATGTAAVATAVSGNQVVIQSGQTGLLAKVHDAESMAENMLQLIENSELRKNIAEAGTKHVQTHYSLEKFGKEHQDLYDRVLTKHQLP